MAGDERSPLYEKTSLIQRTAGFTAIGFAALAIIFVAEMMNGKSKAQGYWEGLNFKKLIFNYHPIFMTTGLILFSFSAILSYRLIPLAKAITKPLHAFFHFCAIAFVIMGLTCVIVGNNYPDYNSDGVYYSNLSSLHSFIGLGAVITFFQNYVLGFAHFLVPESWVSVERRKFYMPLHVFFGYLAVFLSTLAVETGLMELMAESGVCYYSVTSADVNPAENYHLLPGGCKKGNAAGILVLASFVLFFFATYDLKFLFQQRRQSASEESLLKNNHHVSSYHT